MDNLENSSPSSIEHLILQVIHKHVFQDLMNKDSRIHALQKIIVQNQQKLEESQDFVLHLQRRISQLEDCNKQHLCTVCQVKVFGGR